MKHFIPYVCIVAVLFAACKNGELELKLKVEPSVITCPDTGGDYEVEVTSAGAWTATTAESWIKLTLTAGEAGTTTVKVKISANKESAESMSKITFTNGENTVELPVRRAAKAPARLQVVSLTEINAPKDGGEYTIQVESNIRWSAESNVSWAKVDKGVSQNNDNVTVTVSPATTPEETTAVITIAPYGEGKEAGEQAVTITRGSTDATSMSVDPTAIKATADGGSFTVNVSTTAKWKASTTWDVDWFKLSNTEGNGNGSFSITVDPATSTNMMTGIVTIEEIRSDNYKPVVVQVKVTRRGKDTGYLKVDPLTINATATGGEFPVTIKSNYPWTASLVGVKYFSASTTSGDGNATMIVTVKPTTEETEATGYITITGSFGGESARINIRRAAHSESIKFSVSLKKKIIFSPGNLQYQASTETWRFAEHQYDYVGDNNCGNVYHNGVKCNNKSIGFESYDGWIDLFGWGTSDRPIASSMEYENYLSYHGWAKTPILNGGEVNTGWSEMTYEDWFHIINLRSNANELYGAGVVNGVHGLILLPDGWMIPPGQGLNFYPDPHNWTSNVYTEAEWQKMEETGAVFLPCAGRREGTDFSGVYEEDNVYCGNYWLHASWDDAPAMASYIYFDSSNVRVEMQQRYTGHSVRLIREAE